MFTFLTTCGSLLLKLKHNKRAVTDFTVAIFLGNAFVIQAENKFSAAYGILKSLLCLQQNIAYLCY
jgi:drug/metabolite transporter (DMT)-like permease